MGRTASLAALRCLLGLTLLALPGAAFQKAGDYLGKPPFAGSAVATAELGSASVKWLAPDGSSLGAPDPAKEVVVHQHPLPGEELDANDPIVTLLSVPTVVVPDLAGMTLEAAQRVAGRWGLEVVAYTSEGVVSTQGDALIASNDPNQTTGTKEPGTSISVGGTVGVILVSPGSFFSTASTCAAAFAAGAVLAALVTSALAKRSRARVS